MSKKPTTFQWNNGTNGPKARKTRREQSAQTWSALNGSYITKESVDSAQAQVSIIEANKELLSNIRENRSHISSNKENFVDEENSLINSLDENEKQLLEDSNQRQNVRLQEIQGKTAGIEEATAIARKAGLKELDYSIIFKNLTSNEISSNSKNARNVLEKQVEKSAKKLGIRSKKVTTLIRDDKKKLEDKLRGVSRIERSDKETQKLAKGRKVDVSKFGSFSDSDKASKELIKELSGRKPKDKKTRKAKNYSDAHEVEAVR